MTGAARFRRSVEAVAVFATVLPTLLFVTLLGALFFALFPAPIVHAHAWTVATGLLLLAASSVLAALGVLLAVVGRRPPDLYRGFTSAAEAVAAGDLAARAPVDVPVPAAQVSAAFNAMVDQVAARVEAAEREADRCAGLLAAQADELARVLAVVQQGILTIEPTGRIVGLRSRAVDEWLGTPVSGRLQEVVGAADPAAGQWIDVGLKALADDALPRDVVIEQLPKRILTATRALDVRWVPIQEGGRVVRVLVSLTDATGQLALERVEVERQEVMSIFQHVRSNAWSFSDWFDQSKQLVQLLQTQPPEPIARRILHTLRANAAAFGVTSLERALAEPNGVAQVAEAWDAVEARITALLPERRSATISVSEAEYRALVDRIRGTAPALLDAVRGWEFEPAHDRLSALGDQARRLADRLGRAAVRVEVDAGEVRLEAGHWASLWAAVQHVVRNAVDHGIEAAVDRHAAGKPETATLRLECGLHGEVLTLAVEDDGAGIDWARVAAKAERLGLPRETREELQAALFADGLADGFASGLSAVRAEVEARGGEIALGSEPGRGTRFELRFPAAEHAAHPVSAAA